MKFSFAFVVALACATLPARAATYTFDILASNDASGAFNTFLDGSINAAGTAALPYHRPGAGPFTGYNVGAIAANGEVDVVFNQSMDRSYGTPVVNDVDQVVALRLVEGSGHFEYQIIRHDPDGSEIVLALWDVVTPARSTFSNFGSYSMNNRGEVVAEVTSLSGVPQIVKFAADGSGYTVIAEQGPDLSNLSPPDINDDGVVAFSAYSPSGGFGVYTGDGASAATLAVDLSGLLGATPRPDLNNDGDILVNSGSKVLKWESGSAAGDFDVLLQVPAGPGLPAITQAWHNASDEFAYVLGDALFLNGERVIGTGDFFQGGTIGDGGSGLHVGSVEGLSEGGQIMLGVSTGHIGASGNRDRFIVRVNPEGTVAENPALPEETLLPGDPSNPTGRIRNIVPILVRDTITTSPTGVITRDPCGLCVWVDPIVATGFVYSMESGAPNFASLTLPDPLGIADSLLTLQFSFGGVLKSFNLTPGDTFDFTFFTPDGISEFSLLGIDPGAGADPDLPFTVGLTFVENGFRANLFIDAITVDTDDPSHPSTVPLPAGLPLVLTAFGALWLGRRKKG